MGYGSMISGAKVVYWLLVVSDWLFVVCCSLRTRGDGRQLETRNLPARHSFGKGGKLETHSSLRIHYICAHEKAFAYLFDRVLAIRFCGKRISRNKRQC